MDPTLSEATSGSALLLSTPILLTTHLWSWHPLLADGIWTACGIGALVPQFQHQLVAMTQSPFYTKSESSLCPTPGLTTASGSVKTWALHVANFNYWPRYFPPCTLFAARCLGIAVAMAKYNGRPSMAVAHPGRPPHHTACKAVGQE